MSVQFSRRAFAQIIGKSEVRYRRPGEQPEWRKRVTIGTPEQMTRFVTTFAGAVKS